MQNWQTLHRHSVYVFKGKKIPTYLPSQKPAALLPSVYALHQVCTGMSKLLPLCCAGEAQCKAKMKQKEQSEIQR